MHGRITLCGLLLGVSPLVLADGDIPLVADGELTFVSDSNLSRGDRERDRLDDSALLASAGVALRLSPGFKSALNFRAFAEAERFETIRSLDRTSVGGQAIFRGQTRLGYTAPIYQLSASVQRDDHEMDQRDSTVTTVQSFVQRRLTDDLMGSLGIEVQKRKSDGTVFDVEQGRVFANLDYAASDTLSLYGVYSFAHGDTFSSAQLIFCNGVPANDIFGLVAASEALEPDAAFNEEFCGSWIAYRLRADTHSLVLGLNHGFGHHLSADLSVQQVEVRAEGDNNYSRTMVRAGILARF
jgi:hypothetical protein